MGHGHLKTELRRLKDNLTDSVVDEEPIDEDGAKALGRLVDYFLNKLDEDEVIIGRNNEFVKELEQMLKGGE